MEKKEYTSRVTLTPSEGMYLYNGTIVAKVVHAPLDADLSQWQEISQEEGDNIKAEQAKAREAEIAERKAKAEAEIAERKAKADEAKEE